MATVTWTGPQPHTTTWSGRWENTTAWIGGVPVASSDVVLPQIAASGGYTVDVLFGGAARSLTTTGGADGGTLRIRGGDFVLAKNGLNNSGGVQVFASASLSISGTAANAGMLSLNGGTLLLASTKTTLNGGGAISFAGGTLLGPTGTETLTNVDNTLSGAGQIQALTLVNGASGLIEGEAGGLLLQKVAVSNSGVMEAAASGLLSLDANTTVTNAKTGAIEAAGAGATLKLGGAINGGVLSSVAGSLIDVAFATTVTGATINNAGALKVEPGQDLYLTKVTLNNTGTVSLTNALMQTDTVTLAGKGTITLSSSTLAGPSLTNVDNTISGTGTLFFSSNQKAGVIEAVGGSLFIGGTGISNAGTIQASGGAQLQITSPSTTNTGVVQALTNGAVILYGAISNAAKAVMQAETGGALNFLGGTVANSGVIQAMAGATVSLTTGVTINNSAKGAIEAAGAGATLKLGGAINAGLLSNVAGSLIDVAFATTVTGATINNAGALKVEPGQDLYLTKVTLNNTGTVSLTNALMQTDTVTLAGKGTITLSSSTLAGPSLTNVDNTISGTGTLFFSSNQKAGVIEAVGGSLFIGGTGISNAGTIQASGGAQLQITSPSTTNTGVVQALTNGAVILYGAISNAAKAVMQAETGGALNFLGGTVANSGVIQAMAGATVSLTTGVTINNSATGVIKTLGAGATLSLAGTIDAGLLSNVAGGVIDVKGPLTLSNAMVKNSGVLSIDSGVNLTVDQSLQLSGKGHVTMASSGQISGSSTSATFTNVDNTLDGAGTIKGLTLVNQAAGVIQVENGALTLDPAGGSITNAGTLHAGAGGVLTVKGDLANASTAKLLVDWTMTVEGVASGGGLATVGADGVLHFEHAADTAVKFTGAGFLQLDDSDTFTGAVTGLALGATLDLEDINPAVATYSYAGGVLTVTDGVDTAHIHLVGSYTSSLFSLTSDAKGGTLVGYA